MTTTQKLKPKPSPPGTGGLGLPRPSPVARGLHQAPSGSWWNSARVRLALGPVLLLADGQGPLSAPGAGHWSLCCPLTLPVSDFLSLALGPGLWGSCGSSRHTHPMSPQSLAPSPLAGGLSHPTGCLLAHSQPPLHLGLAGLCTRGLGILDHLRILLSHGWYMSLEGIACGQAKQCAFLKSLHTDP